MFNLMVSQPNYCEALGSQYAVKQSEFWVNPLLIIDALPTFMKCFSFFDGGWLGVEPRAFMVTGLRCWPF